MVKTLSATHWLAGKRVAVAGRLASMTRQEAARLIAAHGGIYSRRVTRQATLVIVGRSGWPLAHDGRPTRSLRRALALVQAGCELEILPEEELLARLRCDSQQLERRFTLRELTAMLDVSDERLATWLRAGLITPTATEDGIRYFDFRQVAGVKTLCDLVRSGITTARLRQSFERLRSWLPVEDPLAQLSVLEHSKQLVVRLENGQLAEPSGQLLFEFDEDAGEVFPASVPWVASSHDPRQWFERGATAEDAGDYAEAAQCYREALLAGGPAAETCFNLANVLCALGEYGQAGERYRQVLELEPGFWEAWNNLGTVLTYDGQNEEAVSAYQQALRLNPAYADAHYNLADTLDDLHRWAEARDHWRAYLVLESTGDGADYARLQLQAGDAD